MVRALWSVQLDPTAAIAPSADLVAWSRLGEAYRPEQLVRALEEERTLFEHRGFVRAMADLALHRPVMASWPDDETGWSQRIRSWMAANRSFQRYLLGELEDNGPLLSRDLDDRSVESWPSTGWTNNRNVTQMLAFLAARGVIAVAGRRGRERLWDLPERVYPAGVAVVPLDEARRIRDERWLRALGVARPRVVGDAGITVEIEGTSGSWRLDPEATAEGFEGRTAVLSPFDRLTHDRARSLDLFGFEYILEMYKPKDKRRWGYFAIPVLHDDQLVGKVDATTDRRASALDVHAIHQDVPFSRATTAAVRAELETLAVWLGLDAVRHE
jgi:uncharacterized protein YcaQ